MSEELNLGDYKTFEPINTPFGEQVKAENPETGAARLISHDELLQTMGHDPNEQQAPVSAIHHGEAHDRPVIVTGSWGVGEDNREYLKIEGSDTGVPRDEIEFVSPDAPSEQAETPEELAEFSEYDLSSKALDIKEQLAKIVDKERSRRKRLQDDEPLDTYEKMMRRFLTNEATIDGKELSDEDRHDLWVLSQRSERKLQRVIEDSQKSQAVATTESTSTAEEQIAVSGETGAAETDSPRQAETATAEPPVEVDPANVPDPESEARLKAHFEMQDSDEYDFEPGQEVTFFSLRTLGFEKGNIKGFVDKDGKNLVLIGRGEADKEEIKEVEPGILEAWQDEAIFGRESEVTSEDALNLASRRHRLWAKMQEAWTPEKNKKRKRRAKFMLGAIAATNLVGQVGIVAYVFRKEWKRRHPAEDEKKEEEPSLVEESKS